MAKRTSKPLSQPKVGLKYGFRSGLEEKISAQLTSLNVAYEYEEVTLQYLKPARKSKYTPDFILPNGVIIESKGRFVTADRQKHILIKDQHPGLDIRFVFSNPNTRISKQSATTYAMWCNKHGFQFAKQLIPVEWVQENPCPARLAAIQEVAFVKK